MDRTTSEFPKSTVTLADLASDLPFLNPPVATGGVELDKKEGTTSPLTSNTVQGASSSSPVSRPPVATLTVQSPPMECPSCGAVAQAVRTGARPFYKCDECGQPFDSYRPSGRTSAHGGGA
jgi:hypothetical protein